MANDNLGFSPAQQRSGLPRDLNPNIVDSGFGMFDQNYGNNQPDINSIYQSTFGRPADAGGLAYWSNIATQNPGIDLKAAISAGAQKADITARDDINAGGVNTGSTWGNGASLDAPVLNYDATNNTWGKQPVVQQQAPTYTPPAAPTLQPYQKNPYLDEMAGNITQQANDNWGRNIQPGIRSGAMATGGYGGSRQGVVEANALNDSNRSLNQSLTNLYGNDYQQTQGRNLQQYGMDQGFNLGLGQLALGNKNADNSYNLGLRSSDLGFAGLDANINQNNFNNQMTGANFGLNTYNTLMNNNQTGVNAGTNIQNAPLNYQTSFGNQSNAAGGLGGSSSQIMPGSPLTGALGGMQLYNAYNQYNPYSTVTDGGYSVGQGSAYGGSRRGL